MFSRISFRLIAFLIIIVYFSGANVESGPVPSARNGLQRAKRFVNDKEELVLRSSAFQQLFRELDINIDADHEEGVGTDLTASATANLYKTGNTRVDGTIRYSQHFSDFNGYGNARVGGSIHLNHNS